MDGSVKMSEATLPAERGKPASEGAKRTFNRLTLLWAVIPLILLAIVLGIIRATDGGLGNRDAPPIETLAVTRIKLPEPGLIELSVLNDGPDPISIAQVRVDDAYWSFTQEPAGELGRRDSAKISIPYPWVKDEAHAITLISSTGVVFDAEIPVALESPSADRESIARYGLIGLYVGIVPVALGLLWYPLVRQLGRRGLNFVLALTVGLLVFLVVDMFLEAQEVAREAPVTFDTQVLVPLLAILTAAFLVTISHSLRQRGERQRSKDGSGLMLAYQIAFGIGLHNLGEGLAIGSAFAIGEAALGTFLIVGFTLHNVTEGVGIAAPMVRNRPALWHFFGLAAVAGGPAIIGTWIGAFTFSSFWTAVFLAIGVGAIIQVIYEVGRLVWRSQTRAGEPALTWTTFGGVTAGIAVMYLTALLVTA
jgi:ZIP family zinc transporter